MHSQPHRWTASSEKKTKEEERRRRRRRVTYLQQHSRWYRCKRMCHYQNQTRTWLLQLDMIRCSRGRIVVDEAVLHRPPLLLIAAAHRTGWRLVVVLRMRIGSSSSWVYFILNNNSLNGCGVDGWRQKQKCKLELISSSQTHGHTQSCKCGTENWKLIRGSAN